MSSNEAAEENSSCQRTTKTVYLIRHAESEENRRIASLKNVLHSFGKYTFPKASDVGAASGLVNILGLVDSELSPVGAQQVQTMGQMLRDAQFVETAGLQLVLHSPLQRARATSIGLLQCMTPNDKSAHVDAVEEWIILSEKFPSEWVPGNFGKFLQRIASFEAQLAERDEHTIAVVGHSQYFKAMLKLDFKFHNCDVWKVKFDPHTRTWAAPPERLYSLHPGPPPSMHKISAEEAESL